MPKESKEDELKKLIPEGAPASVTDPIPREKLPKDLQKIVDREDDFLDDLYDGQ